MRKFSEISYPDARLLSAVLMGALIVSLTGFYVLQQDSPEVNASQNISVGGSVSPYSTNVRADEAVRFVNSRNVNVSVNFETKIKDFILTPSSSKVVDFSKYSSLAEKNYFTAAGEGGRLVITSD